VVPGVVSVACGRQRHLRREERDMTKWEYLATDVAYGPNTKASDPRADKLRETSQKWWASKGEQGWELVAVVKIGDGQRGYFKRPAS